MALAAGTERAWPHVYRGQRGLASGTVLSHLEKEGPAEGTAQVQGLSQFWPLSDAFSLAFLLQVPC